MDVVASFALKVLQSAAVRRPRVPVEEAFGILKLMVLPVPVMVKSEPMVVVAKVMVGPACVCPVGPIAVMPPPPVVRQVPFTAKQPA